MPTGVMGRARLMAVDWQSEIDELHHFFEAYFLGTEDAIDRVEAALHPDFTIVGPTGVLNDRAATIEAIRAGHGHTTSLRISVLDHRLLLANDEIVLASYIERHDLAQAVNERLSTVAFVVDPSGPNGLRWLRVQETWLNRDDG